MVYDAFALAAHRKRKERVKKAHARDGREAHCRPVELSLFCANMHVGIMGGEGKFFEGM